LAITGNTVVQKIGNSVSSYICADCTAEILKRQCPSTVTIESHDTHEFEYFFKSTP
jgi:hypothetical protein